MANMKMVNGDGCFLIKIQGGGLTSRLTNFDSLEYTSASPMFYNLCQNESFRIALAEKLIELGKGVFSKDHADKVISAYVEQIEEPMNIHMKRFWGVDNAKFYSEVESTQLFFDGRFEPMVDELKKNFPDLDIDGMLDK